MRPKRYFLYARKSSESEDRQVLSIEVQVSEMEAIARREGWEIVETFAEARSAKTAGKRLEYSTMIDRLEKGEATGILCWRLNRLARNMRAGWSLTSCRPAESLKSSQANAHTGPETACFL